MDAHDLQAATQRGIELARRANSEADPKLLREAVAAFRAVLEATPHDHENLATYRSNLGNALRALGEQSADVKTLREAADVHRSAVEAAPDSPTRARCQSNMANCLQILYENSGDLAVLAEALDAGNEAVRATPPDDPQFEKRSGACGIAARLLVKAVLEGAEISLPLALAGQEAAGSLSLDDENFVAIHTNLGDAFHTVHERTGDMPILRMAVQAHRTALAATPEGSRYRALSLLSLGNALSVLGERTGALDDVTEAVELCRQAVAACVARGDLVDSLTNLSTALQRLFERTGEPAALSEAVDVGRAAVKLLRRSDPDRHIVEGAFQAAVAMAAVHSGADVVETRRWRRGRRPAQSHLNNHSLALLAQYQRTADLGVLKKAAKAARAAVAATPPDRPEAAGRRCNLAQILEALAERTGDPSLVTEALEQFRAAGASTSAPTPIRIMALRQIPRLSHVPEEGAAAMEVAVGLLPGLAPRTLRRSDQEYQVAQLGNLAAESASAALAAGRVDLAVDLMERARGLLTAEVVHGRLAEMEGGGSDELVGDDRVVFLAASALRCDAVIVSGEAGAPPMAVGLTGVTEADCLDQAIALRSAMAVIVDPKAALAARKVAQSQILDVLAWLWDTVAEPVLTALGHTGRPDEGPWPRLWWCPAGIFAYLPLHAAGHHTDLLVDDPAIATNPRTVLDRVVSSYIPTLRSLRFARSRDAEAVEDSVLIVAAPDALPGQELFAVEADELPALSRLLPSVSLLLDPTRASVLAALPHHRVVHFSCHGLTDEADPSRSYLVLPDHETAPLTVTDIAALRLNSGLAFLSACETALAKVDFADEALHLTGAFHLAGYRHVIGTLWPIGDAEASSFAKDFYTRLTADGTRPPDLDGCALAAHHATRRLRERFPVTPSAWAAYLHTGC